MRTAEQRRDLLLVALGGAILFLTGLGAHDLWNPDEPRYAEIAREMMLFGGADGYLVPRLNGEVYSHKPPLLFWSIVIAAKLRGVLDEVAVRLPVAVSALASTLLLWGMTRRWLGRRAAWIAVGLFATCVNVMLQARSAQIDMLLVGCVTAGVYCWVRGHLDRRALWNWGFFLCGGLGVLAKGPVGLLPPLLSIVVFLLVTGQRERIRELHPLRGLLLAALVALLWLAPAGFLAGEDYVRAILFKENVTRFATPWGHLRPWYYFLQMLPGIFFPWALLIPSAAVYGWRRIEGRQREGFLFGLCWMIVTIVFFSISPGKRTVYVLTMFPGMCLMIAAALDRLARDARASRLWVGLPSAALAALAGGGAIALPRRLAERPQYDFLGDGYSLFVGAALGTLAVGALVCTVEVYRRRLRAGLAALATGSALFGLAAVWLLTPPFDAIKSPRELSRVLTERAAPDEPVAFYRRLEPGFLFYSRRFATVVNTERALADYAATPGRVWLLGKRHWLRDVALPAAFVEIARDRDETEGFVLFNTAPRQIDAE